MHDKLQAYGIPPFPLSHKFVAKLHIGVDADSGAIVAVEVTKKDIDDAAMVGALLDQIADPLASFTADGDYDQDRVYQAVTDHHPDAAVIMPPRATAVLSASSETAPTQRDRHLRMIGERGRMAWQKPAATICGPRLRRRLADING